MVINVDNSCFLHCNLDEACLISLAGAIPYRLKPLHSGFTYLGFFLKPLGYWVNDWLWIIQKLEKRISHWTFQYLSLGGRLVLVNSVLSSIPVYWMSLAPLPATILQKLRSIMFNFLWGSLVNNRKYHLVCWNDMSWPKKFGGWGIKNLLWFNISLRLKNLWRLLHSKGLWFHVIHIKYMKCTSVIEWLRNKHFNMRCASIFWRGFMQILPWLGSCLSWQVGDGKNILL